MEQNSQSKAASKKAILFTRCCDGDATSEELHEMYDAEREITFATFARRVDIRPVAADLGYVSGRHAQGLRIEKDYHIRFYRSKFRGIDCYYLDWSCIDHIFLSTAEVRRFKQKRLYG